MAKLSKVRFLERLLDAALQYGRLSEEKKNGWNAILIARTSELLHANNEGAGASDIILAVQHFGTDVSAQLLLKARVEEERAWHSYERNYADQMA